MILHGLSRFKHREELACITAPHFKNAEFFRRMLSLKIWTLELFMKPKVKTKDDHTKGSGHDRIPKAQPLVAPSEKTRDQGQDFLGKSLEKIIAGVAEERTRADEALRVLAGRLIQVQEEERRRLARELHDGLNQKLAMLAVELGMLTQQLDESAFAIREQLLSLRDRAQGLSNDLRRMTHQLHPAALEHLGLVAALRSHCADFSRNVGIRVGFRVGAEVGSLSSEVAVCLYRITQEALRNVAKHSGAQEALVQIDQHRDEIRLSIVDQGVGFDLRMPKPAECLGLVSIRERVQLISGSVTIKSAPGEGTCVEVRVPIESRRQIRLPGRNHAKTKTTAG
jgi:signal transduction histidine kinase